MPFAKRFTPFASLSVLTLALAAGVSTPRVALAVEPAPQPQQPGSAPAASDAAWPAVPRLLPPAGLALTPAELEPLRQGLDRLTQRLQATPPSPHLADVAAIEKALRFALLHGEFYSKEDPATARRWLSIAHDRLDQLAAGRTPWLHQAGRSARGYISQIDGSAQPYGLEAHPNLDTSKPLPLIVFLHGRGEKTTDLHFLQQCQSNKPSEVGKLADFALVLHPFGRQCLGWKSAGETDVLEAIADLARTHRIDPDRVVLMGFSMGGAGAWHLGAHYAERFAFVAPGAGFADTARYLALTPDQFPPPHEQTLWGLYDVPAYVRNLFNLPVVAYSGELDKQIQAARLMEEAFKSEGRELTHLIGPATAHKYHPATLADLMARIRLAVTQGRDPRPSQLHLQTRTLRYASLRWVQAQRLVHHWQDSRIDARVDQGLLHVTTRNIASFAVNTADAPPFQRVVIDTVETAFPAGPAPLHFEHNPDGWRALPPHTPPAPVIPKLKPDPAPPGPTRLVKSPGLQGPIDDVFLEPFLVVTPSAPCAHPAAERWLQAELRHFTDRWRSVFRGELRTRKDVEVTEDDLKRYHLVLWGDPSSNRLIARALPSLPLRWDAASLALGPNPALDPAAHMPTLIYPSPFHPGRYLALNAQPSFRAAHDRSNSLQNPKLPDWALLRITAPPTDSAAGVPVQAGFFNESWLP